jgi:outer membrane protein
MSGLIALLSIGTWNLANGGDVFDTRDQVPTSPAAQFLNISKGDPCPTIRVPSPLTLFDAVERTLCESPKTRSSWAAIKAAAAVLGQSKAAYLPTLSADAQYLHQHDVTDVTGAPDLRSNYTEGVNTETVSLTWLLYDFGGRSASLKGSREMLMAARATQDATLQAVVANTAKDFYQAQAAKAKVDSTLRVESSAQQSLEAATARVSKGVAPITDRLQANTALAQAVYERAKAEGDYRTALGTLAIDMSVPPDEQFLMPEMDQGALPDASFGLAVHDLLDSAIQNHPKVASARAQWQAALSNVDVVRAQGLPTLQVIGEADRSNQPISASLGQPELPALTRQNYIGVKIQIPLFEGFARGYQIAQAQAQAAEQEQGLRDAEQQVALSIWSSVQLLQTNTDNLRNTDAVLQSARQAFDATQHRYQLGVGNILELLSVQSTMASAEQQRIQAQSDWRTARIQLAASLGQLEMGALQ